MKNIVLMILLVAILSLTSCGTKLNKTWYPLGPGKDTVCIVGDGKFCLWKTITGIHLSMHTSEYEEIAFLSSYDDFSAEDKKVFEKLVKKNSQN